MARKHPDVTAGSSNLYQQWEVVDPGEMGAARLRLRARGFARRRLLARPGRSVLAARDQGFLRLHRMGRRAAVVERQGRAQRHLLLRLEPVARRDAAAAASRRDVHLGGLRRLVSRHDAPRRHPLHVLGELVRHAGEDRAVRRGRARQAQPRARRAGVRAGDAVGAGARQQPRAVRRRHPRASAGGRLPPRPLADLVEGDDAVPLVRQLGRAAAASARQFRGLLPRGRQGQMARGARHRALDAFLHRLRPRAAAPLLRPFPARQEERLGQAAARAAPGAPHRQVRRAPRGRMAAQAHAMDARSISIPPTSRCAAKPAEGQGARASASTPWATASPS